MARDNAPRRNVKDATRDLVVKITPKDIEGAHRAENDACAAANALCRQEHFKEARVYRGVTYVRLGDGSWLRYITPKDLYIEIMIFDRGGRMQAGAYKLGTPKGSKRMGHHAKPTGRKTRTGKRVSPHIVENVRAVAPKGHLATKALFE